VQRIFIALKNSSPRSGLNPITLVPVGSTLPQDHRGRLCVLYVVNVNTCNILYTMRYFACIAILTSETGNSQNFLCYSFVQNLAVPQWPVSHVMVLRARRLLSKNFCITENFESLAVDESSENNQTDIIFHVAVMLRFQY
jgi:hypothetical protein